MTIQWNHGDKAGSSSRQENCTNEVHSSVGDEHQDTCDVGQAGTEDPGAAEMDLWGRLWCRSLKRLVRALRLTSGHKALLHSS